MSTAEKTAYIEGLYAQESDEMRQIRERIEAEDFAIHISPIEGALLATLVALHKPKVIVELGTLGGYSTLWLAKNAPKDAVIHTCEHDPKRAKMARDNLSAHSNIKLIEGDAKDTLPALFKDIGPFDMMFVDADKKSYLTYLDHAEAFLKQGGLLIADDTLLEGAVYMDALPGRVRKTTRDSLVEFNERIANSGAFNSILWPTDAGLTIAVRT